MKFRTKLIFAFSSIVLFMVLLQSFYFQDRTEKVFDSYVRQNDNGPVYYWKEYLLNYYHNYGSLANIQDVLISYEQEIIPHQSNISFLRMADLEIIVANEDDVNLEDSKERWVGSSFLRMADLEIIVADEKGIIIGDTKKRWLGQKANTVPGIHESLVVNGKKIGELIVYREKSIGFLSLEQQFIDTMNTSILFGTAIAVIIAVLLGFIISRRVSKPLEKLMEGINHLTKGDTSYRIEVTTKDEFHQLAMAFNEMSMKLEKNEQIRKKLVADVAHELRTPFSILSGQLESIQEGAIEPTQEVIIQLSDEVFRLSRLANDLQQLSLAEAGKLQLNIQEVDLINLIQRVAFNFKWLIEEKNIDLSFESSEELKAYIDPDRITQVVINILGNALRHTPKSGKVIITVTKNQIKNIVIIEIKDTGSGIDPELVPFIFERFYRTDTSRSRDQGGTGLGLSIAKGFIEAHGGNIAVESMPGEGTSFKISLPI